MTVISSPGSFPFTAPAMAVEAKTASAAITMTRICPDSFSTAIRRRLSWVEATNSRLPRLASEARVDDRARIDHRLRTIGKNVPYLYWT